MSVVKNLVITKVFKNGNSRAVRIPSFVQPSIQPGDEVEIHIKKTSKPRYDWARRFKKALENNPDTKVLDEYGELPDSSTEEMGDTRENWDHLA